jgi:hypothetical protein
MSLTHPKMSCSLDFQDFDEMNLKPWGPADWLLPRINVDKWHVITSTSFEDRCLALVDWMSLKELSISSSLLIRIKNPPSDEWSKASSRVDENYQLLTNKLQGTPHSTVEAELLGNLGSFIPLNVLNVDNANSVILDITTLPKRFFLFALKLLLSSDSVKNLVVTYARADRYPEASLCEDALPPTALPGFGRVNSVVELPRMIVGVGYMPLSVEDLLDKAKHSKLDFIFPFPPASPAFRRSWGLLSMLMPADFPRNTEIHRIHGMDAFEVFEQVYAWGRDRDLDLIPLGPKPHALGMGMAYLKLGGRAELLYSQPQVYRHDYSSGVAKDIKGSPIIYSYCLKHAGKQLF